jgi:hypothetical protein
MGGRITETDLDNIEAAALGRSRTGLPFGFEHAADTLRLVAEVRRLRAGRFTEEEFQGLCHGLSPDDRRRFEQGCRDYQAKLFGPITPCQAETFPQ